MFYYYWPCDNVLVAIQMNPQDAVNWKEQAKKVIKVGHYKNLASLLPSII